MRRLQKILCFILALFITCGLLGSCEEKDDSFYHRSKKTAGDAYISQIVDVKTDQIMYPAEHGNTVEFRVGIGRGPVNRFDEDDHAFLVIEAENCVINGEENVFEKNIGIFILIRHILRILPKKDRQKAQIILKR